MLASTPPLPDFLSLQTPHTLQPPSTQHSAAAMHVPEPLPPHQHQQQSQQGYLQQVVDFLLQGNDDMIVGVPEVPGPQHAPAKLATPQHSSLLLLLPPQPVAQDAAAEAVAAWPTQNLSEDYCQAWPTHQRHQGLQEVMESLEDVTLSKQESQVLSQVSHGLAQVLQEPQAVPHLQQVGQGVSQVPQLSQAVSVAAQMPQEGSPVHAAEFQGAERGRVGPRRGRRAPRPRRPKLYEQQEEFHDPQQEKRRRDAINAWKNRVARKAGLENLRRQVREAATLQDDLRREVADLKRREALLLTQLRALPPALPAATTLPATTTLPPALPAATALTATLPAINTLPPDLPAIITLPVPDQSLTTTTTTTTLPTSITAKYSGRDDHHLHHHSSP